MHPGPVSVETAVDMVGTVETSVVVQRASVPLEASANTALAALLDIPAAALTVAKQGQEKIAYISDTGHDYLAAGVGSADDSHVAVPLYAEGHYYHYLSQSDYLVVDSNYYS